MAPSDGGLAVAVKRGVAEVLGSHTFPASDLTAGAVDVKALYDVAAAAAGRVIYAEIIDSIKLSGSSTAGVTPAAAGVSEDVRSSVLKRMSGKWMLDYSRGKEVATIRDDGTYSVEGSKHPRFRLVVLAANEDTRTVEVAKDTPDGRRRQIEYLTITEEAMTGHAKHDGHRLVYRRHKL